MVGKTLVGSKDGKLKCVQVVYVSVYEMQVCSCVCAYV